LRNIIRNSVAPGVPVKEKDEYIDQVMDDLNGLGFTRFSA
jgi:hypothetical protein